MDFSERAMFYQKYRKADSKLTDILCKYLNVAPGATIADIGAGTGNYSAALRERNYNVLSVEPEIQMQKNSTFDNLNWVTSHAERICLPNSSVDGVIIVNAIHHFSDFECSVREIFRIINRGTLVIFTFDPDIAIRMWIFDYWEPLRNIEKQNYLELSETINILSRVFGKSVENYVFPLPADFEDVFSATIWSRPHFLFKKDITKAMSLFNSISKEQFDLGLKRLECDLKSGSFYEKYPYVCNCDEYDVGCRILVINKE